MIIVIKPNHFKTYKESGRLKQTNISKNGKRWIILGIIGLQAFLTVATYHTTVIGLNNLSQLFIGVNLLVFALLIGVYKFGKVKEPRATRHITIIR